MSTKSYIHIPYCLWDHNVQSSWESFIRLCPRGTAEFWTPRLFFWGSLWNVLLHIPIYRWFRYMSKKNCTYERCRTLRKNSFSTRGMLKCTYKGQIWPKRKHMRKCAIQNSDGEHMHWWFTNTYNFFFWETWKSQFLVEFQSYRI